MKKKTVFLTVISLSMLLTNDLKAESISIDESKIVSNVLKSLSVPPTAEVKITDLKSSQFPNFYQGIIEFKIKNNQYRQPVYISTDSRYYFIGNFFDADLDYDQARRNIINLENAPYKGNPEASVTIVEYSDLQCGSCKKVHEMIQKEKLIESYEGKVKLVFKGFPLKNHSWASQASIGCLCAYQQKPEAFWNMTDEIFSRQSEISPESVDVQISSAAQKIGLNMKKFSECYEKKLSFDRIHADMSEGNSLGVQATPTFVINGRVISGVPEISQFREIIDYFLSQK